MGLGNGEIADTLRRYRSAMILVAVLSAVLNVIILGGSFYLMMIYDSVLPSHSLPTLFGLFAMICVVYLFQGLFDHGRTRILASMGEGLERILGPRIQAAMGEHALRSGRVTGDGLAAMRDLDQIRGFLTTGGPTAILDLPWVLFFLAVLAMLHVWLGVAALVGALVLFGLTVLTNRASREPTRRLSGLTALRASAAETNLRHAETIAALGMRRAMLARYLRTNHDYLEAQDELSATANLLGAVAKVFRLFLQSAILTVGAWLVIHGEASGGVIFGASLLSGRALAPVDQAIANWRNFAAARAGWTRLEEMLARVPVPTNPDVQLPMPRHELAVDSIYMAPPGCPFPTVQNVSLRLAAGDVMGLIGPSGAGKTSLGRALVGIWRPQRGTVRLDGSTLEQWEPERLGSAMGYLPQSVELFEGTIAQNIARFIPGAESDKIIKAAEQAGVHDLIVSLSDGYETQVGRDGETLSAGQRQRIGLARALYGDPFLVLLDEPNSNLDQDGEAALDGAVVAIKARGGIAILVTHRPNLLARASHVGFMRGGMLEAFGPRDEVLAKVLRPVGGLPPGPPKDMKVVA